jgi:hypothetical protein
VGGGGGGGGGPGGGGGGGGGGPPGGGGGDGAAAGRGFKGAVKMQMKRCRLACVVKILYLRQLTVGHKLMSDGWPSDISLCPTAV